MKEEKGPALESIPVLELKNVYKDYVTVKGLKTNALNGIDFQMGAGEFTAIMGPSGSGKSTLLNVAAGIDMISSGAIFIGGENISEADDDSLSDFRRKNLGIVFQDFNLLNSLTVRENIMVPRLLDGGYAEDIEASVLYDAAMLGIEDILDKYPYELSGGQQQRTAICRAIINEPAIVFADEPTGNLDSKSSGAVMEHFVRINKDCGSTILMVTHDPLIASYCRRVVFLSDGEIVTQISREGTKKEFHEHILIHMAEPGGMDDVL